MTGAQVDLQDCTERLLQSDAFRNAPASRRLLRYLADQTLAGHADQLKEYTIGVDAFGKGEDYDPRKDSTVRIQIGRLRQKLIEYYGGEGKNDGWVLELPKGRMRLHLVASVDAMAPAELADAEMTPRWKTWPALAALMLVAGLGLLAWDDLRLRRAGLPSSKQSWSSDLEELWQPFLSSGKQLVVSVGDPLFVQFEDKTLFRDPAIDKWEDLRQAVRVTAKPGESRPVHYYAAIGEVHAAFLLGQRLAPRQPSISIVQASQLLWQQMAASNVLLLGPPRIFVDRIGSLPVSLEIIESPEGFRVVHPNAGQESLYPYRNSAGFFSDDGAAAVLVTHAPGPAGNTDMQSFASNSTFGRLGAIDAFTDAGFARTLVAKMRGSNGVIPKYYQVLLQVRYKGGVPTETSYVLHRELKRRE